MTTNGNNIYETTLSLTSGNFVSYKFVNGSALELVPLFCGLFQTNTQDVARFILSVPSSDTILDAVCFNSCSTICSPLNTIDFSLNKLTVYPNPVKSGKEIVITIESKQEIKMFDLTGKLICKQICSPTERLFIIPKVEKGVYLIKSEYEIKKIIVE